MVFLLLFFLLLFGVLGLLSFKKAQVQKKTSFESGFNSLGKVVLNYSLHFFFLILIFVFFDLELIFLLILVFTSSEYFFLFLIILFLIVFGFLVEWFSLKLIWFL